MRRLAVIVLIACGSQKPSPTVATSSPPAPQPSAPATDDGLVPPQPTVRLPRNFVPTAYDVRLAIDPAQPKFDGAVDIAGKISERSRVIWLHGFHLEVQRAVARQGETEVPLTVTPRGEDLLEVRAAEPLAPGEWTLHFTYRGELDPVNTTGAFRQTVGNDHYVFTQLEAVYARRVFPSFDEPNVKVPWKLTFDIPKALTVVANTPQVKESPVDDRTKRVEFATSKPMPSYLVAFGIGPFDIVDAGKSKRGTPIRMVTLRGRAADAKYAAQTSPKIVDATEDWFGTPYPYEKLDMLTIPLTVGFGAMENAGLITYTERLMLLDKQPSQARKRLWTIVAAHEVAHQWFGNLVTPEFWDDIWLNEGFASWLAYKITAQLEPQWKDDESAVGIRGEALENDALVSARKVRQPIETPDDIRTAFDRITYAKGAAILFMFENYLGEDVFQRGVREYLAARAWGNATSSDFVAAIAKASGQPVDAAFATFLDQAGAPELTATTSCTGGKVEVSLAQRRYLPPGAPEPAAGTPWIVPVCLAYEQAGKRAEHCTLLDKPAATVALDAKSCPRWVLANATGRGYYRTAYPVAQITALRDEAWPKLTWPERRALHHDVTTAARTGKLPLQLALSFTPKLLAGNDRFTVAQAVHFAAQLDSFVPDELRTKYEHWLRTQFGRAAAAAGLAPKPNESLDVEETRESLITAVGWTAREPTLVAQAVKLAAKWRELPESLRPIILKIATDAKPALFEQLLRELASEPERAKRNDMFAALGAVRDPARYKTALALAVDPKIDIREAMWLPYGHSTESTREVAKQFVRDHKDAIMARIPNAQVQGPLARYAYVFTSTCKADQRDAIADYVTKTFAPMAGGARVVKQAIEAMDQCIARRKLLEPEVRAWLGGMRLPRT